MGKTGNSIRIVLYLFLFVSLVNPTWDLLQYLFGWFWETRKLIHNSFSIFVLIFVRRDMIFSYFFWSLSSRASYCFPRKSLFSLIKWVIMAYSVLTSHSAYSFSIWDYLTFDFLAMIWSKNNNSRLIIRINKYMNVIHHLFHLASNTCLTEQTMWYMIMKQSHWYPSPHKKCNSIFPSEL